MAKRTKKPARAESFSAAEMQLIERLVERGALVTKAQQANAKPRRVMAAALSADGQRIILWLSKKTTELG